MIKNERLALAGKAFEDQIKAAQGALKELFLDPVKDWLLGLKVQERVVGDCVKVYIQSDKPKQIVDAPRVAGDFTKALVQDGLFTLPEITKLVEDGVINVTDPEAMSKILVAKNVSPGYTITIPGGGRPALRLLVTAKGRFEGLSKSLKSHADVESTIRKAAEGIETIAQLELGKAEGKVLVPGLKKK